MHRSSPSKTRSSQTKLTLANFADQSSVTCAPSSSSKQGVLSSKVTELIRFNPSRLNPTVRTHTQSSVSSFTSSVALRIHRYGQRAPPTCREQNRGKESTIECSKTPGWPRSLTTCAASTLEASIRIAVIYVDDSRFRFRGRVVSKAFRACYQLKIKVRRERRGEINCTDIIKLLGELLDKITFLCSYSTEMSVAKKIWQACSYRSEVAPASSAQCIWPHPHQVIRTGTHPVPHSPQRQSERPSNSRLPISIPHKLFYGQRHSAL